MKRGHAERSSINDDPAIDCRLDADGINFRFSTVTSARLFFFLSRGKGFHTGIAYPIYHFRGYDPERSPQPGSGLDIELEHVTFLP